MSSNKRRTSERGSGTFKLSKSRRFRWLVALLLLLAGALSLTLVQLHRSLPALSELRQIEHLEGSHVLAADGEVLGAWFIQNRNRVRIGEISTEFIDALLAIEDIRFYRHNGIDYRSLLRVAIKTILLQQESGGGSTLTQQLVKNLYPRRGTGPTGLIQDKLREMITARRLESLYSKEEILELYLNTVSFGEDTYGIETASQRFFGRSANELDIHQAALLAGLLQAPGAYNPRRFPDRALQRRNVVLMQMERYGMIEPDKRSELAERPLDLNYSRVTTSDGPAPWFRERVRQEIQQILRELPTVDGREYSLYTDGLTIRTTLDYKLQITAEKALVSHLKTLQDQLYQAHGDTLVISGDDPAVLQEWRRSGRYRQMVSEGLDPERIEQTLDTLIPLSLYTRNGEVNREISPRDSIRHHLSMLNGGFLAMAAETGEVKAWVGGLDHRHVQYDHVTARRQVGSAFKPILYATALENGVQPCDYRRNRLNSYEEWEDWTPRNVSDEYGGYWSVQAALARSVNTIAVDLLMETGMNNVQATALNMGLRRVPAEPSIALGSGEASLLEMIQAYAIFASGGERVTPHYIVSVHDAEGRLLYQAENPNRGEREQVLSAETAAAIVTMLSRAVDEGTGQPLRTRFGVRGAVAGKTGTTQNYSDGWFIGMTPDLVFGVWTGAPTPRVHFPAHAGFASQTALPIAGVILSSADGIRPAGRFHPHQTTTAYHFNCNDYRDDSILDRFRDAVTGQRPDEPRRVQPDQERKSIIDRVRNIFR